MLLASIFPLLIPAFFLLFVLGFVGTLLWHKHKEAIARTAAMKQLSETPEFTFSEMDSFGLLRQLQDFNLFERERRRWFRNGKITNIMHGLAGDTAVFLFDYTYTVQAGKTPKKISQTVFLPTIF